MGTANLGVPQKTNFIGSIIAGEMGGAFCGLLVYCVVNTAERPSQKWWRFAGSGNIEWEVSLFDLAFYTNTPYGYMKKMYCFSG